MAKSEAEKPARVPIPTDGQVGKRIRTRRLLLGMSLETLATALGLTYQQVGKYELGTNRVSALRLFAIAEILGVPISYFFGDVRSDDSTPSRHTPPDLMERPETIELVRLYYAIRNETVRYQAMEIVQAIAEVLASLPGGRGAPLGVAPRRRRRFGRAGTGHSKKRGSRDQREGKSFRPAGR